MTGFTRRLSTVPPGTVLHGGNVTVNNTRWESLWSTWDWNGWIKPQVDRVAALGANTVRLIGNSSAVAAGTITQATYLARWTQFLDYTAILGLYAYPCGGDFHPDNWGTTSDTLSTTLWGAWAALCHTYPHVIALDVSNEAFAQGAAAGLTRAQIITRMTSLTTAVRAQTTKPVGHSRVVQSSAEWASADGAVIRELADFHDIHLYYDGAAASDVDILTSTHWGDRPLLLGEFGALGTGQTTGQRVGRYTAVVSIVTSRPNEVIGALAWAITDTNTDPSFGTSGLVASDGTVRTDIANVFATLPTSRPMLFPRYSGVTIGGVAKAIRLP